MQFGAYIRAQKIGNFVFMDQRISKTHFKIQFDLHGQRIWCFGNRKSNGKCVSLQKLTKGYEEHHQISGEQPKLQENSDPWLFNRWLCLESVSGPTSRWAKIWLVFETNQGPSLRFSFGAIIRSNSFCEIFGSKQQNLWKICQVTFWPLCSKSFFKFSTGNRQKDRDLLYDKASDGTSSPVLFQNRRNWNFKLCFSSEWQFLFIEHGYYAQSFR